MSILDEKIERAKNICLLGHINPDGDCIGSTLSIYNYIKNKYDDKVVKVYLMDPSEKFSILKGFKNISSETNDNIKYDLAIICDASSRERVKDFIGYADNANEVLVFDHHETNNFSYENMIIDIKSPATCEIIYKYMDDKFIDKNVAECLYVGICSDTGCFKYNSTTHETMNIAGNLMDKGIDFTNLQDKVIFSNSLKQRRIQAIAFNRIKCFHGGQVVFSYVLQEELDNLNLDKKDIDNIIVYLREIEKIKIAIFAYPIGHNIYKLSIRSNDNNINVATFARNHDGGGHAMAAGFTYKGNIEEIEKKIDKDLNEII